jgi:hypothetical protein
MIHLMNPFHRHLIDPYLFHLRGDLVGVQGCLGVESMGLYLQQASYFHFCRRGELVDEVSVLLMTNESFSCLTWRYYCYCCFRI